MKYSVHSLIIQCQSPRPFIKLFMANHLRVYYGLVWSLHNKTQWLLC